MSRSSWLFKVVLLWIATVFGVSEATAPQIEPMKPLDNVEMGQRVTILCAINRGTPPISFSWRKNGIPITQRADLRILHNDDFQETLQISPVTPDHVGNYTCAAKNSFGTDQIYVAVVPKFKPVWNDTNTTSLTGVVGSTLSLDCSANGQPTPIISISKGKAELSPSRRFSIKNGFLEIRAVLPEDRGEYHCQASNILGNVTKRISIVLSGNVSVEPQSLLKTLTERGCMMKILLDQTYKLGNFSGETLRVSDRRGMSSKCLAICGPEGT